VADRSVAVVIPAYQAERFVGAAIESVLDQPCPVDQIVVVDDGSTDRTAAVARSFGPPVVVVERPNGGIGAARNTGVSLVGSELLAFLDADDLWTRAALESRLGLFEDPLLDAAFGQVSRFVEIAAGGPVAAGPPLAGQFPTAMLIRRRAFERVGAFAEGTAVSEGLDWLLRAQEAGLVTTMVDETVLWRRVHGANNSLLRRGEIGEYARTLKASLDRKRAAREGTP